MERNYSLRFETKDESSVTVKFWSEKRLDLRITDIKFFSRGQVMPESDIQYVQFFLDNNWHCHSFYSLNKNVYNCTSLNFIVKDVTSKTQYAVRVPLDGGDSEFTKMTFEGR